MEIISASETHNRVRFRNILYMRLNGLGRAKLWVEDNGAIIMDDTHLEKEYQELKQCL